MTALFENTVTLRGILANDAEVPSSEGITDDAFAVLLLATTGGAWNIAANEWKSCIEWHRVICPGPYLCGFTRGMRRGDYLEVEGELRTLDQERSVRIAGERFPMSRSVYAVHAAHIRKLERPLAIIDMGRDG